MTEVHELVTVPVSCHCWNGDRTSKLSWSSQIMYITPPSWNFRICHVPQQQWSSHLCQEGHQVGGGAQTERGKCTHAKFFLFHLYSTVISLHFHSSMVNVSQEWTGPPRATCWLHVLPWVPRTMCMNVYCVLIIQHSLSKVSSIHI